MTTPIDLLTLSQWLSLALPVGAFNFSHGLEAAVAEGWEWDADGLRDWLADLLTYGSAQADALVGSAAFFSGIADMRHETMLSRIFRA